MGVTVEYNRTMEVWAAAMGNIHDAFEDAGEEHEKVSKNQAPVDDGDLKASIQSVTVDGPDGPVTITTVAVYYGVYQEYGTGIHAGAKDASYPRQAPSSGSEAEKIPWVYYSPEYGFVTTYGNVPQPFMRPGYEAGRAVLMLLLETKVYD